MAAEPDWIAVDWGTSNLRAWCIDPHGGVTSSRISDRGMSKLSREDYQAALLQLLDGCCEPDGPPIDVIICGMAGARQGWLEAPYLDTPAYLGDLLSKAVRPLLPHSRLTPRILPGVCQRSAGTEDVMRGEETQLLGLSVLEPGFAGVVCMPGTHCKWVRLNGLEIEGFASAMTGEVFELLKLHSVLRHSLAGALDPAEHARGLTDGLAAGIASPQKLLTSVFKVRAAALLSERQSGWCMGFLSGLLVGTEIGGQRDWIGSGEIPLIGGEALVPIYAQGLSMIGAKSHPIDAITATLAGLRQAWHSARR